MGLFIILGRYFRIESSDFDGLKGTTISPFVYAVFPSHDFYGSGCVHKAYHYSDFSLASEAKMNRNTSAVRKFDIVLQFYTRTA